MISGVDVILASGSPRRAQLLRALGIDVEIVPANVSEAVDTTLGPVEVVELLALRKAASVGKSRRECLVIGADTVVMLDDEMLGKPRDSAEAEATLARLSGRSHLVYTGVAIVHMQSGRQVLAHESTRVTFAAMTRQEIAHYVAGGSPMDKAGSYGIQEDLGAIFISRVEGDFYNVMGLPAHRFYSLLKLHFPEYVSLQSRLTPSN